MKPGHGWSGFVLSLGRSSGNVDQHLRELERRWRETSSVEDEVAFLRERLRCGDLSSENLALAAWLGHRAAERIVGPLATSATEEHVRSFRDLGMTREEVDLEHWLRGLGR